MMKSGKQWIRVVGVSSVMLGLTMVFVSMALRAKPEENIPTNLPKANPGKMLHPRAPLTDDVSSRLSFSIDSLCRITDPNHTLDAFLEELAELIDGRDTTIQIVHLGDSHIQAGFYSGQTMHMLQDAFGNAGRGWIAPFRLARDNEPNDYFITSSEIKHWTVGRCIQRHTECAWGPGGIGIQTDSPTLDFTISVAPNNGAGYEFNQVIFYRSEHSLPMLPIGYNHDIVETVWGTEPSSPDVMVDTFKLPIEVESLQLYSAARRDLPQMQTSSMRNCYYGCVLTNGHPGILYHAIGQNGAMFTNFTNTEYIRQLSLLDPSLLIVTLGTNEAYGLNFSSSEFTSQIDQFVQLVKTYLPCTALVLSTPAENYRSVKTRRSQSYERNTNISLAAEAIKKYAAREGIACFDLYGMTGGAYSCERWLDSNFLGKDRVHFSANGYYEQGKLLYKAIVRSELDYQKRKRQ